MEVIEVAAFCDDGNSEVWLSFGVLFNVEEAESVFRYSLAENFVFSQISFFIHNFRDYLVFDFECFGSEGWMSIPARARLIIGLTGLSEVITSHSVSWQRLLSQRKPRAVAALPLQVPMHSRKCPRFSLRMEDVIVWMSYPLGWSRPN